MDELGLIIVQLTKFQKGIDYEWGLCAEFLSTSMIYLRGNGSQGFQNYTVVGMRGKVQSQCKNMPSSFCTLPLVKYVICFYSNIAT